MARNNRLLRRFGAGAATAALALGGLTLSSPQAAAQDWSECLQGSSDTQAVFERAARIGGVPSDVLLGVGYLSSRWNQHAGVPSTSGGYGVMHLSDQAVTPLSRPAKGDSNRGLAERAGTLQVAAELTGYSADSLKRDHVANICGGAAVLASYQPNTTAQQPDAWSKAVALYAGTATEDEALQYADMVFDVLRSGASETTDTGDTVTLAARPQVAVDTQAVESTGQLEPGIDEAECPSTISCEIIEAQYRSTGPAPTQYVNYDLADRENDLSIDYLVVHNTECTYDRCIQLIKGEVEPNRFVSWHYTLRSADGHVAQHVGWLRRHAPERLGGDAVIQPGQGRLQPWSARAGRHPAGRREGDRLLGRPPQAGPRCEHLRRCGRARVVPALHHRPAARCLEQSGGALRRHRRRERGPAVRRHGLRCAAQRCQRDH